MPISEIILISMGLLTIAIVAAGLFRHFSIPYTVLLVVIGIGLSELSWVWPPLESLHQFQLTPDLVFFIFLPALIFESGLSLDSRQLLKDLAPVLTLAVPALLMSTALVGFAVWFVLDIDLTVALLFGALISATDPVAVVSLFRELGAPNRLNVLIEGESLFNDATAIVVFGILLSMLMEGGSISLASSGGAILEFLRVFVGGVVVGVVLGLLVSELLYRLQSPVSAILTLSIVTAYASFIIAEHSLHVSGVMATLSAAVALTVYGLSRIPVDVKPALNETWELIGLVANSLLFLLVGLSVQLDGIISHLGTILVVVVIVQLARAASVYALVPTTLRLFKLPAVSMAERHIMWWGGLKGGLAIAIVLSIPESLPGRELLINLTLGVVVFTLMVNGWSIRPLMHRLRMDRMSEDETLELAQGLRHAAASSADMLQAYAGMGVLSADMGKELESHLDRSFGASMPAVKSEESWREVYMAALRIEFHTLDQLYKSAVVSQYILLDIRNTLILDRENYSRERLWEKMTQAPHQKSIFQRLEMWVLRALREKNWAIGLLSRYQQRRLTQHIQRDIAGIVMTRAVIESLSRREDFDTQARQIIVRLYRHRFQRWNQRLEAIRVDFSDLIDLVEHDLFSRSALITAQENADYGLHHGEIGVKAFNRISQIIDGIQQQLTSSAHQMNKPGALGMANKSIAKLPLFKGLSSTALAELSAHLQSLTFLAKDIIIGEGEKGDALYIIRHGVAEVSRSMKTGSTEIIGELHPGDFFGEQALLGDHLRGATVRACTTVTLLRLTRRDVERIAARHQEIWQRLKQARDERNTGA